MRVGVTTAKVMAQALRIPVVPIVSLDLVAYPLRHTHRAIVAVLDARRREVFRATYRPVPGGVQRVSDYAVGAPADLVAELAASGDEVLLAGDGVAAHAEELGALDHAELAGPEFAAPSTAALVALAAAHYEREEFSTPWEVEPLYLRESDAELSWGVARG
jgi:tRNA threonylcarbamoyladenosine biosynthesis protein TsaB